MSKIAINELINLMDLLDEPDEISYDEVRKSILSFGMSAVPFLETAQDKSFNILVQDRTKDLLHKINFQNLYSEVHNWATLNSGDLLEGYFLISKFIYPELEEEKVMAQVEALRKEVWLKMKPDMTPFESAGVISKVFFQVKYFSFNDKVLDYCESLCLNNLLNNKKGFPTGFGLLYAGIAQRLELPIYGVSMPESPFLAYVLQRGTEELNLKKDVMFYLNPFAEGVFFPKLQIENHVIEKYPNDGDKYVGACTNLELILSLVQEMKKSLQIIHKATKIEELEILEKALVVE